VAALLDSPGNTAQGESGGTQPKINDLDAVATALQGPELLPWDPMRLSGKPKEKQILQQLAGTGIPRYPSCALERKNGTGAELTRRSGRPSTVSSASAEPVEPA
jgi:hypothetical protein